jgi:hypothetical protein
MDNQSAKSPETSVIVSNHENSITTNDMFDQARAKSAMMVATQISTSSLIPEHYQRRPENVMVAMYRAARLGMDLFSYMEVTYPVHGRLGHEAKFVVARINSSGKFKGPIRYEFKGEITRDATGLVLQTSTRSCTAWSVLKDGGDRVDQTVDLRMAFSEGWATKPGPDKKLSSNKWHTMTDVMLKYRAAKFFGNMYCPEAIMGLDTKEEIEDIADAEVVNQTETGKDIFEKGEEVSTTAEPVLDPAMEVKPESAPIAQAQPVPAPNPAPVEDPAGLDFAACQEAAEELPAEPPQDPKQFLEWLKVKFARESSDIDCFLMSKNWLGMGDTIANLTESKLKNLRAQWSKFLPAYDAYKKTRKAA